MFISWSGDLRFINENVLRYRNLFLRRDKLLLMVLVSYELFILAGVAFVAN